MFLSRPGHSVLAVLPSLRKECTGDEPYTSKTNMARVVAFVPLVWWPIPGQTRSEDVQDVLAHGTSTMGSGILPPPRARRSRSCQTDWGISGILVTRKLLAAERLVEALLSQSLADPFFLLSQL